MQAHNIRIYRGETALRAENAILANIPDTSHGDGAIDESSLAYFCSFVDFYTRKTTDPFSTSLACEKQAEAVEIAPGDVTPENIHMLMDTMLEVIDHLEKKWLDEQIKHEDRQRAHREDVARLSQQVRELQPQARPVPLYKQGVQWLAHLLFPGKTTTTRATPGRVRKRRYEAISVVNTF